MMYCVVGFGKTGRSVVDFFESIHQPYCLLIGKNDVLERESLRYLCAFGLIGEQHHFIQDCQEWVVSPGVDPAWLRDGYSEAKQAKLLNDIELFYRHARAPIIAVTGTNGKSTVTSLLHHIIQTSGYVAYKGGNIGIPALDLLKQPNPDYYVLELSSFQIELLHQFQCEIGMVLNVQPDHLDRHKTFEVYKAIKLTLLDRAKYALKSDDNPFEGLTSQQKTYTIAMDKGHWTIYCNQQPLLNLVNTRLKAKHDAINLCFVYAVIALLNIPIDKVAEGLMTFHPLPHRFEQVATDDQVIWINDSKATNLAATLSALQAVLTMPRKACYLIMGGQAKEHDFSPIMSCIRDNDISLLLYGEMVQTFLAREGLNSSCYDSLEAVLATLKGWVQPGDIVLFSPGGASFDCHKNYAQRGELFKQLLQV